MVQIQFIDKLKSYFRPPKNIDNQGKELENYLSKEFWHGYDYQELFDYLIRHSQYFPKIAEIEKAKIEIAPKYSGEKFQVEKSRCKACDGRGGEPQVARYKPGTKNDEVEFYTKRKNAFVGDMTKEEIRAGWKLSYFFPCQVCNGDCVV